jgi:hypothetical protein
MSTPEPDALLLRDETAEQLTLAGFKTASATLATLATRGGGPPYRLFGRRALYRWADAQLGTEPLERAPPQHIGGRWRSDRHGEDAFSG